MTELVYYEQPLNERIRTFLRLEHLFCQTDYTLRGFSIWDSRATLITMVDTLEILSRSDFKTELLKEIERQQAKLQSLQNMSGVDDQQLTRVLERLQGAQDDLHSLTGQLGQSVRENDLLNAIKQRQSTPGGTCPIDIPLLHYWLQQEPEQRIGQLEQWHANLSIVRKPVALLLGMIREASIATDALAPEGFYQQSLDTSQSIQLIRVGLHHSTTCFAEISAGKHRLTIRFLEPQPGRRPQQVTDDVAFELTCCAI